MKECHAVADISQIQAVGHRVVHGGERFAASVVIDEGVEEEIQNCVELAPLHNPHNLRGYYVARKVMPQVPQVAVFDTAFHQTMPPHAYIYGLPYSYYRRYHIRRYGFHGTSHRYVAFRYRKIFGKARDEANLITAHLGNGCSITAIDKGHSIDTSMGFTPQEGLLMGTRCGDIDPAALFYIMSKDELTLHDMSTLLNKFCGLYGISGESNDMRELMAASAKGDEQAKLAIEVFCYRIKKYIGAYTAALGHVDGLVFTGGIGENSPAIRALACEGLSELGIQIDPARNAAMVGKEGEISTDGQPRAGHGDSHQRGTPDRPRHLPRRARPAESALKRPRLPGARSGGAKEPVPHDSWRLAPDLTRAFSPRVLHRTAIRTGGRRADRFARHGFLQRLRNIVVG